MSRGSRQDRRSLGRRAVLGGIGGAALLSMGGASPMAARARMRRVRMDAAGSEGWAAVPHILERIVRPRFAARDFEITRFGAKGDGLTDARAAINAAIDACSAAGGGRVVVPPGTFLSNGPLRLKSNVNLFLDGSTVKFSTRPSDYLPMVLVRWEGTRCYNYSPLVYALREKNLAITGTGTLDGQADVPGSGWWRIVEKPSGGGRSREDLRSMGRTLVPVENRLFGDASTLRPSLLQTYECANLLLEGVTLANPPFWTLHPTFTTNITVRKVTMRGHQPHTMPNDDGFVADSCRDVLVENCTFDVDCDNVSIKAGRDNDAWNGMSCERVVVRNSTFVRGCGVIVVGSEVSGGVRDIFCENNVAAGPRYGIYVKSNAHRGGVVERLFVRKHTFKQVEDCIRFESNFMNMHTQIRLTPFRDIQFDDVTCGRATDNGIRSEGIAQHPMERIGFRNVTIDGARIGLALDDTRPFTFDNVTINGVLVSPQARR